MQPIHNQTNNGQPGLLTPQEIKEQTRALWRTCFHDSEAFMDIYFEDKYADDRNLTIRHDGRVVAAMQLLPYRTTFYGSVLHTGYVSGLCTHPDFRRQGHAARLLYEAHRRLYARGAALSFLIPQNEELRHYYEQPQHGAYWTAVYRKEMALDVAEDGCTDGIEVRRPDEWNEELYVFYHRLTRDLPFMVHPAEDDFFAAVEEADLCDGYILTAYSKNKLSGFCIAVPEQNGKVYIRTLALTDTAVRKAFVEYLCRECGVGEMYRRFGIPGTTDGTQPYAMARVVNVKKFLTAVAAPNHNFSLHIGVDGDLDIPENNGYYVVERGRVSLTDQRPDTIVTPGGLAALFMAAQPLVMDLMLDE